MSEPRTLLEEVQVLREHNKALTARVRVLERELRGETPHGATPGTVARLMRRFRLTHTQARILFELSKGAVLSPAALRNRCCAANSSSNVVQAHMCSIRRGINPLKIGTDWGSGYWLDGDDLKALRAVAAGK